MADYLLPAGQAWYGRELHASIPVCLPSYGNKHLRCEQPVKEIQLTSICYVQICVYSSSYSDFLRWIDVSLPRSPTPPVPITISSSRSPLLSFTPVQCMDTANFINVEVRVCYSFSKHNILSTKAIESFVVVWYRRRDPSRKPATRFFDLTLKNSLTFASDTKTMQMAWEEVAEVSFCYYSRDSCEILWKFPCLEAVKFTDCRDSSPTGEFEGPVPGDQEAHGQVSADRQASDGQEREPTDSNQWTAETMGRTLQGAAEPPHSWLTTRHPTCRERIVHQLWQTLKDRDQEGHHDPEEWEGCRTRWDTSRSHQSRHRDSRPDAIQPLQQDLGEGGGTGPVERRNPHQAAKKRRP